MQSYKYIIIGSAAAGISALNKLSQIDPQGSVVCISDETDTPYNKCFLADYLLGEKNSQQVSLRVIHKSVQWKLGVRVININPDLKCITLSDNAVIMYEKLLLATGSRPWIPPIKNIEKANPIVSFYNMHDTQSILDAIKTGHVTRAVVIGAGLSGLECADGLVSHGIKVSLVDQNSHVLQHCLDRQAASRIENKMHKRGVLVHFENRVAEIICSDEGFVSGVLLGSGECIDTDMVICATGLRPNSQLARDAGLRLEGEHVWVDDCMQTSNEHIFAAGDVVKVRDQETGELVASTTWPDAMHQGLIAASNMAGVSKQYPGVMKVTSSAFFGIKFATGGRKTNTVQVQETACFEQQYFEKGHLVGFCQVGEQISFTQLRRAIASNTSR